MIRGVLVLGCVAALFGLAAGSAAAGPLQTAVVDGAVTGPNKHRALNQIVRVGATMVRIDLIWAHVAPLRRPNEFTPTDPDDPAYNWAAFDQTITAARAAGLEPIVSVMWAPAWAEGGGAGSPGTRNVDAVAFGQFARAAATRYSGSFVPNQDPYAEPLPRIRYWMAWNEPNRDYFFRPQYDGNRRLVSPALYRAMVNRFASSVHAVNPNNFVIAGALAPLGKPGKPAPLSFMRSMLSAPVEFDAWSHHPYTSGGPTHSAVKPNDVAIGDLGAMRKVLTSARRRIASQGPVQFWVTEFSWDSNPPDPRGLPAGLHARWTAEALYRMWRAGVSVVTWYRIQDDPLRSTPYQSGFFTTSGRQKGSLKAFRFPTVALTQRRGIYVWARTPRGVAGTVVLEINSGRGWRRLATVRTGSSGIVSRTFRTPIRKGHVRARFGAERSLSFSLTYVRDRYVNPFGCGGGIPC